MAQLKSLIVTGTVRSIGPLYLNADAVGLKTVSNLYTANSRPTDANLSFTASVRGNGGLSTFKATSAMSSNKPAVGDSHVLHLFWDNNGGYDGQIALGVQTPHMCIRNQNGGTWSSWVTLLDATNYTTYTPVVHTGTAAPAASLGKNGDIYIVTN